MATVTVTQADVVAVAPELAGLNSSEFTARIAEAAIQLDPSAWGVDTDGGTKWNLGIKYLVAHMLSVSHPEQAKSDRVPTYEKMPRAGAYNDSRHGVQFFRLRRAILGPIVFLV